MESLIPASIEHMKMVWEWRNDKLCRAMSISPDYITWETHLKWYSNILTHPFKKLFIYSANNIAVAVVRFDLVGDTGEISINVSPEHRGKGIGTSAIGGSVIKIKEILPKTQTITAVVKKINAASLKAFLKNGFEVEEDKEGIVKLKLCLDNILD